MMQRLGKWLRQSARPALAKAGRLALLALAAAGAAARADASGTMIFEVDPYRPAPELRQRFGPLTQYFAEALGRDVELRVARGSEEHLRAVGSDGVDLAYLGPVSYVRVVDRFGALPILARIETDGKPVLDGVIAVRADSSVQRLADLKGKRFAFGDAGSALGSITPRYLLLKSGVGLDALGRYANVASNYDVVMGVLDGEYDAGALRHEVYDAMAARGLRAIAELPAVSEGVFVARRDLPPAQVRRLRRSLLQLRAVPGGMRILQAIGDETTGMARASDADFAGLRAMLQTLAPTAE